MVKLKIKVTKEILEKSKFCGTGINSDELEIGTNCAIALAVRDIFPNAYVSATYIDPFSGFKAEDPNHIHLPITAQVFIDKFDVYPSILRTEMEELEFEIEIPDTVIEKINISEITSLLQNHPTLKLQEV